MKSFIVWAGIASLVQILIIPCGLLLTPETIFALYLWPLLLLPHSGGSHGGELILLPVTLVAYSALFGFGGVVRNLLKSHR